ncbi:hypothetical protein YC2023_115319 [Brassica napus]
MQLSTTAKIQANQIRYTSLHYPNTHPPSTTPLRTPLPFTNPLNTHPPVHNSPENTSLVHKSPEHTPPVHNSPENTSPIHRSPEHTHPVPNSPQHTSPVHNSPKQTTTVHNSPQHTPSVPPRSKLIAHVRTSPFPASPSGTPPWLYTPESFPVIYRSSSTILLIILTAPPPPLHHLLNQGLEIFEPFSQEPSSLNNPRYDTSSRKDPQQQLNPITPETSPTKSSGFPEHADSVNAFAATATSKRTSAPILNFDQRQEDCVDVSDSSPARPTPWHQPSDEECHLAVELRKCPSISALALLVPLPHTQWELFKSTLKSNIQVTVEAKVLDLVHDFQSLSKSVTEQIDSHKTWLQELEVEMMSKLNEHMSKVAQSMDEATRQFKEDMHATLNSNTNTTLLSNNGPVHNFASAVGIVLAIACLYWKLL